MDRHARRIPRIELRVIPDPAVMLQYLGHRQVTRAFAIGQTDERAVCHQFGPAGEVRLRVDVMLPPFPVDHRIDVRVPRIVAAELVAYSITR